MQAPSFLDLDDLWSQHRKLAANPPILFPHNVVRHQLQEGQTSPGVFHRDGGEDISLVGGAVRHDSDAGFLGDKDLFNLRVEVVLLAGDGDEHVGKNGGKLVREEVLLLPNANSLE